MKIFKREIDFVDQFMLLLIAIFINCFLIIWVLSDDGEISGDFLDVRGISDIQIIQHEDCTIFKYRGDIEINCK